MKPLSDQQRLFLVESDQVYRAWLEVLWCHHDYKYGMRWKSVNGKDYLLRITSASGNSKSLGPRSLETEQIFELFQQGKAQVEEKYQSLKIKIESQMLGVGFDEVATHRMTGGIVALHIGIKY